MYKVRFNLGKGPRYMTWKITHPNKDVEYLQPNDFSLTLINAKLRNHKGSAEKIYEGANKRVCAWIECEDLKITERYEFSDNLSQIMYNPRVKPYWRDHKGNNIDGHYFNRLRTLGHDVFEILN
jgi:hypothetical protein